MSKKSTSMAPDPESPEGQGGLWKAQKAARYLALEERALRSIRQRGEIAFIRVGHKRGRIAYRKRDLDAYIKDCVQEPVRRRKKRGKKMRKDKS